MLIFIAIAWPIGQIVCVLGLRLGRALVNHRWMQKLGRLAYQRKMQALDRFWPLTRLRSALADHNRAACTWILASLIVGKSLLCFALGPICLAWLPLACLMVPSIITQHDRNDVELSEWVQQVARWQVTSHLVASIGGAAILYDSLVRQQSIIESVQANTGVIAALLIVAIIGGWIAGRVEADGLLQRGLISAPNPGNNRNEF